MLIGRVGELFPELREPLWARQTYQKMLTTAEGEESVLYLLISFTLLFLQLFKKKIFPGGRRRLGRGKCSQLLWEVAAAAVRGQACCSCSCEGLDSPRLLVAHPWPFWEEQPVLLVPPQEGSGLLRWEPGSAALHSLELGPHMICKVLFMSLTLKWKY